MDIPDIAFVVQFMVASSLSVLIQRFGRAGRSGQPAVALLLAEPSVFQVKKKNQEKNTITRTVPAESEEYIKEEPIDDSNDLELPLDAVGLDSADVVTQYRKKTEIGMQDWCLTLGCRGDVSDKYFNNPSRSKSMSDAVTCWTPLKPCFIRSYFHSVLR
jgi:superfamily II DNA helicase RecQ